jgi:hypothetical protein
MAGFQLSINGFWVSTEARMVVNQSAQPVAKGIEHF